MKLKDAFFLRRGGEAVGRACQLKMIDGGRIRTHGLYGETLDHGRDLPKKPSETNRQVKQHEFDGSVVICLPPSCLFYLRLLCIFWLNTVMC